MKLLLRLYPRAWRERYGEEFLALLAEHPPTLHSRLDICRCALDARLHYHGRSPMFRKRTICSFCGHPNEEVQRMVAGPGSVAICSDCVALCTGGEAQDRAESCSFCGKTASKAGPLTTSQSGVAICDECVALCVRIIDSEGGGPGGTADRPGRSRGGAGGWRSLFRGHHQAEIARP